MRLKFIIVSIFLLVSLTLASDQIITDYDIIKAVNSNPNAKWVAGENSIFKGKTMRQVRGMFGAFFLDKDLVKNHPMMSSETNQKELEIPKTFDSRDQWTQCSTIRKVLNQAHCGSCWAFSGSEVLSDRMCVKSQGKFNVSLSPQDMVSCDRNNYGCNGGYLDRLWSYLEESGVVTDKCYPYQSGDGKVPECASSCSPGSGEEWKKYKAVPSSTKFYPNIETAQSEIMLNGPVQTGFKVYSDFMNYKSGVYHHIAGGLAGGHAVKVIGWGVDATTGNTPYWIVANSWGEEWGINGFFWILRGKDECGIESNMIAGEALYQTV